ncbi:MAG: TIGR01777 family protein [Bdellovibrionales bacterium]|nr:TIGR01777 family protein [Bdellovibrionales bacterium]
MKNGKRILITGATGLVGVEVSKALIAKGYDLVILGRRQEKEFRQSFTLPCEYYVWNDSSLSLPPKEALSVDYAINLMGESIAKGRWTKSQMKRIWDSRIPATKNLVTALNQHAPHLSAFISASAIGYYGDRGNEILSESTGPADDFMARLCVDWEEASREIKSRCVQIRIGLVMSHQGGALAKMAPLFENNLGTTISDGRHWISWIHIDDLVKVILFTLINEKARGSINAVSPNPVTNAEFTKELARALKAKALLKAPSFALKLALGEMAKVVLSSQKVTPSALTSLGFVFKFPEIVDALQNLYSWKRSKHDRLFQTEQWVPKSREAVFGFFADERNLEELTPKFLDFHIVGKTTEKISEGTEIEYKLRIHGIPTRWKAQITSWRFGEEFKDVQTVGPYKVWEHRHLFFDLAGGTLLKDQVVYQLPLAKIGGNIFGAFIAHDITKIFEFRKAKIAEIFGVN